MEKPKNPVFYVTRDRERATALPESDTYKIISGEGSRDTFELLSDPKVLKQIKKEKGSVLVFKNNIQIEEFLKKEGVKLLNPSATLAEKVEKKITQVAWLEDLQKLLPPHEIKLVKDIAWNKKPFIVQWSHSHTGDGTLLIQKESDLEEIKKKFPEREARVTEFVRGPMFTANVVISGADILLGNISYQITGTLPFTDNPFSTIGNDWSLTHSILTEAHIKEFEALAALVGSKLLAEGWKGLFGIDVIYNEELDTLSLIEINARQPASTTYESQIQESFRKEGIPGITTFEAHLAALTDTPITQALIPINDGAQIIQRVTSATKAVDVKKLKSAGYTVIEYKNTKINSDLARIQSKEGIMETHNKLNKRGKEIVELLDSNS
jgi:predicted ATP-grasp superfamily ATP-dependent carboligase